MPPEYLINGETGCWEWQLGRTGSGYGVCRNLEGKQVSAHRFFFEQANGPIPDGLQIDHLCRTRACVNPDHMELVTIAVNVRRGNTAKLDEEAVRNLREIRATTGATYRVLASRFGISLAQAWRIVNNQRWNLGPKEAAA